MVNSNCVDCGQRTNGSRYRDNEYCLPCFFLYLWMDPGEEACCMGLLDPGERAAFRQAWARWLRGEQHEGVVFWRA